MPKCKDLTGQKFGRLTVLRKTQHRKNNAVMWECQCACGNIKEVSSHHLTSDKVKSCGCYNSGYHKSTLNLVGQKFGELTVVKKTEKRTKNRGIIWKCQCSCGNFIETTTYALQSKQTTSCGCKTNEKRSESLKKTQKFKRLEGQIFGKLLVLEFAGNENNGPKWLCECQCEKHTQLIISSKDLLRGHKRSCGCMKSEGETAIEQILKDNNIEFELHKKFEDCIFPDTNYHAYFDFYVQNKYLIEFDGRQHFFPWSFGSNTQKAEDLFKKIQYNDKFKNKWAKSHNIPLIRIPYTYLKNLTLEDLILESSNFIIGDINE